MHCLLVIVTVRSLIANVEHRHGRLGQPTVSAESSNTSTACAVCFRALVLEDTESVLWSTAEAELAVAAHCCLQRQHVELRVAVQAHLFFF